MNKILILLISICFLSWTQEKDLRKIYSKDYFENWYQSSHLTILENDTLKELQQIVDAVQRNFVEGKAADYDGAVFTIEIDSLGNEIAGETLREIIKNRVKEATSNQLEDKVKSEGYLFYDAKLRFEIVDSVLGNYHPKDFKSIYFNPAIEQFKGKVIYIGYLDQQRFKALKKALNTDNDNSIGYYYRDGMTERLWKSYYLEFAPFNRHIQSLIYQECLDYSATNYIDLRPVNTIRSIALTKDFKEAAIEIEPDWSTYFYIKKDGKWVINEDKKPLINYIE